MKHDEVKKRLVSESIILLSILGVLGGVVYYLDSMSTDYQAEAGALEGQVTSITAETTALREKYVKVTSNTALYEEVMRKNANDELLVNRQSIGPRFRDLQAKHFLNFPSKPTAGNVNEVPGTKTKNGSLAIVSTEVNVTFEAVNDEDVYKALNDIYENFPGVTKVRQFSIRRVGKVTEDALRSIAEKGQYPLVTVNMQFTWFGVKILEPSILPAGAVPASSSPRRRR